MMYQPEPFVPSGHSRHNSKNQKTVLVTGANGYVRNAVAKAFRRAGWHTSF